MTDVMLLSSSLTMDSLLKMCIVLSMISVWHYFPYLCVQGWEQWFVVYGFLFCLLRNGHMPRWNANNGHSVFIDSFYLVLGSGSSKVFFLWGWPRVSDTKERCFDIKTPRPSLSFLNFSFHINMITFLFWVNARDETLSCQERLFVHLEKVTPGEVSRGHLWKFNKNLTDKCCDQ